MTTLDLDNLTLAKGAHEPGSDAMCVMEAVALLAGEQWTDYPQCASPVISAFLRSWNDSLDDDRRQTLKQYIRRLIGSAGTREQEAERAWLATDWLVRVHAPTWLRLAGLTDQADTLVSMQPVNPATCSHILPALRAVRSDAYAAYDAAYDAARAAAGAAAGAAAAAAYDAALAVAGAAAGPAAAVAGHAAYDAARAVAYDAAGAAYGAAGAAAGAAARAVAYDATGAAARAATGATLQPTANQLHDSAHQLVDQMLAVTGN